MRREPVFYARPRKVRIKKKKIFLLALVVVLLLGILIGANTISVYNRISSREPWAQALKEGIKDSPRKNYLVLLLTESDDEKHLAGAYFFSYAAPSYALYLPGDTAGDAKAETLAEIFGAGGTKNTIESITAILEEPVHYFTTLDSELYSALGEAYGLDSPAPSSPGENGEDIMLEASAYELDALNFFNELAQKTTFWRWPAVVKLGIPFIETNLNWRDINALAKKVKGYSRPETWRINLLPGSWSENSESGKQVFVVDAASLVSLLELAKEGIAWIPRDKITVEVLNGSGVAGLAKKAAELLEKEGFTVVRVGNADNFDYAVTQVISSQNDLGAAKEVACIITGADLRIEEVEDTDVMVTVIIGHDY
ncbi:MAG TPA: LytR C-terminal domain-containing protein [Firmicutes bacterium]|nr:LytR C-terminal domain-containing protein [Bacillota bacterium]